MEIRKQKREESMAKRRNLDAAALSDAETDDEEAVGAILDTQVSNSLYDRGLSQPFFHIDTDLA